MQTAHAIGSLIEAYKWELALFYARTMIASAAAALIAVTVVAAPVIAGSKEVGPDADLAALAKGNDIIEDLAIGSKDAKVTVVEYASMTCPHCAKFHKEVYPGFKAKYIDTGKVRFIYRDFPLNSRAFAGAMLARCVTGADKSLALVDVLFNTQADWAFVEGNPQQKLFETVKQAGFTQESFEKCLTDQKVFEKLSASQKYAGETIKISATPSFFVNGKRMVGPSLEEISKVIDPMLGEAAPAAAGAATAAPAPAPTPAPAAPAPAPATP
jgi:protein-disulfide isomerase